MARGEVYTIDQVEPERYICTKYPQKSPGQFESGSYEITRNGSGFMCSCFAGTKTTCRHREMVEIFTDENLLTTGSIYDYDHKKWILKKERGKSDAEEV